jgi:predicted ATPase
MHKVTRIEISGFKRLKQLDIEMRPLMVMIGANGVGKTSILDAISLLSASAAGEMNRRLGDLGGIADVLTRGSSNELCLKANMDVTGHQPIEYDLQIEPQGQSYAISNENLTQSRIGYPQPFIHIWSRYNDVRYFEIESNRLIKPVWEHKSLESSLSQVPKMFQQPEALREVLSSITKYHVLDVSKRAPVKLPQPLKPANLPGENGEDLISFLFALREGNRERFEIIEDTLKAAFPSFEALSFPPAAAGMLSLTWKDKNFSSPIYVHQLSEGTLRFLWLISLLQSPGLSAVTMIDEPEVSLHPELLSLLADLMRETSERSQIIVATHSDRLIRFLKSKEVLAMDVDENGSAVAQWADTMDIDRWLEDYSLDEAWNMGRLGGRA